MYRHTAAVDVPRLRFGPMQDANCKECVRGTLRSESTHFLKSAGDLHIAFSGKCFIDRYRKFSIDGRRNWTHFNPRPAGGPKGPPLVFRK